MAMKMAKASEEEVEATINLATRIDDLLRDTTRSNEHIDRLIAKAVRNHQQRWSLQRVVFGYQVLVNNCCDPDASALEWRKDIQAMLDAAETPTPAHKHCTSPDYGHGTYTCRDIGCPVHGDRNRAMAGG